MSYRFRADRPCFWLFRLHLARCTLGAALLLSLGLSCNRQPPPIAAAGNKQDDAQADDADEDEFEEPRPKSGPQPPILFAAPKFALTDQTGERFGTQQLAGKVWIANFMFTQCAATCPRQAARLSELDRHARRWPDWQRIRLVSITVDAQRDTVGKLHEYAEAQQADHARWKFLTGDGDEIARISKEGFKLPASGGAAHASTPITHSSRLVLVDAQNRIRGYYESLDDKDYAKLLTDLRLVLSEDAPKSQQLVHIGAPHEVFDPPWLEARRSAQLATRGEFTVNCDFEFVDRLGDSGIRFVNRAVPDATRHFKRNHYDHANGIAAADVDGDGKHDLYFLSQVGGNQLWRNLGGGRFEDITDQAGVALPSRVSVTASFADIDNDGDADLFVTTTRHGNVLFENDGQGRFRDITAAAGLEYSGHSSSGDFFDYDRDGRLDLLLTNVGVFTTDEIGYSDPEKREHPYYVGLVEAFDGHLFPHRSESSILYHNEGDNRFRDVSQEAGFVHDAWSGDATPIDLDDDGWIDLYVLNMQGNDECYLNVQGRFERASQKVFPEPVWGGMGVKSLDYNNDGRMDLLVTNMHADMWELEKNINGPREKEKLAEGVIPESYLQSRKPGTNILGNALFENRGGGKFQDVSLEVNAENYWPWGPSAGDLNADGYQDLFIASCMNFPFRYHPNSLLLNDRGQRFRDAEFILGVEPRAGGKTAAPWFELDCSGADAKHELAQGRTGRVAVCAAIGSRSAVIFDLDQDGDLDIVTSDFNTPPTVLVSNLSERKADLRYVTIALQGTHCNRDGLGAKVQVTAGGRTLTQVHDGQSGYLSQSALPLYFGLGDATVIDQVSVQWLGGQQQVLKGPIETNRPLVIVEGESAPR